MVKKMILVGTVVVALLALQCSGEPTDPDNKETRELTNAEKVLVQSGNSFGLKLFQEIVNQEADSNIFISPLSVAMALGMTYNGARNETQQAMQEVLELKGMTLPDVNESYRTLIDLLLNLDPKVKFQIANSIWYRDGLPVYPDFIDLNRTYFDAEVTSLDFNDPAAVVTINNWVDEKTNGKIDKIIDKIGPQMVMYLINAIYFKGDWTAKFDTANTRLDLFILSDGSPTNCQMMFQHGDFFYFRGDGFAALDLPYGDGKYSMTIFLPDSVSGVDALIAQFSEVNWEVWFSSFQETELDVFLPKFELEYELKLNDVLSALGMGIAFDEYAADFSGIAPLTCGNLYISEVKHKTYVKVDEDGTEAAAVTSVGIAITGVLPQPQFRADHPFTFVIRENHSGTILFIGKIVEPVWEG
ncbi:MAG: serpin family protein [candidate division Zixibacteria bacterium]|nr:serpin family protein [candidate division Zixibacteria bacterium]